MQSTPFPLLAPSLSLHPSLPELRCPGGRPGYIMGQGGPELGACRDEVTLQGSEDTCAGPGHRHSDVTRDLAQSGNMGLTLQPGLPRAVPGPTSCSLPHPCPCSHFPACPCFPSHRTEAARLAAVPFPSTLVCSLILSLVCHPQVFIK
jgi:hypothetical protein